MQSMKPILQKFVDDETGATAIEYALIGALIGIAVITAFQAVATSMSTNFSEIASEVDGAV